MSPACAGISRKSWLALSRHSTIEELINHNARLSYSSLEALVPADHAASSRVSFTWNVSLDGLGTVHDRVRGIPGAFERPSPRFVPRKRLGSRRAFRRPLAQSTSSEPPSFSSGQVPSSWRSRFALPRRSPGSEKQTTMAGVHLSPHQASFMRDFLESPALLGATRSPARRLFYHDLAPRLTDRDASTRPLCLPE